MPNEFENESKKIPYRKIKKQYKDLLIFWGKISKKIIQISADTPNIKILLNTIICARKIIIKRKKTIELIDFIINF